MRTRSSERRSSRATLVLAASVALSACTPGANLPPLADPASGPYRLGVGDQLRIITVGGDQLTAEYRIGDSGDIAVPLLGSVRAAGLSTTALGAEIADKLEAARLFRDPSVVVQVTAYRPIDVLGEVNRPGEYPYRPGMTMLSAVAVAGGFTYRAVTGRASVVRTVGPDRSVEGRIGRESFVAPGDVLTIFERQF